MGMTSSKKNKNLVEFEPKCLLSLPTLPTYNRREKCKEKHLERNRIKISAKGLSKILGKVFKFEIPAGWLGHILQNCLC